MATDTGVPFWGDSPEVWDTASIGGETIQGVCRITGDGMRLRSDQKRAAGRDGASVAMLGLDVVSFTIDVKLWTEAHLRAFQSIIGVAKPKTVPRYKARRQTETVVSYGVEDGPGGKQSVQYERQRTSIKRAVVGYDLVPLEVSHPALALFGVTQCIVESISLPSEQSPGLWTAAIRCREFRKPETRGVTKPKTSQMKQTGDLDGINKAIDDSPAKNNAKPGT